MDEGSIWSGLGSSVVGSAAEVKGEVEELKVLIQQVQAEILGSIEALGRRMEVLEQQMSLLQTSAPEPAVPVVTGEFGSNALMFMSQEELGLEELGKWPEPEPGAPQPKVVKSGFTAPPPVPEDEEVINVATEVVEPEEEIEFSHVDHGRGDPQMWARRTVQYIKNKGGVVNQYLKRFDLVPEDITKDERNEFKECLGDLEVQTYVVNQIRHFYYIGEKEEGESLYSTVYPPR